jgi:hypothetical protein
MFDLSPYSAISLLVDLVIALTVLEAIALVVYHRLTGLGVPPKDFALNIVSGLCLMLALRCVLSQMSWMWIASCLSAAGLAHAMDIMRRWKRQRRHFQ